MKNAQFTIGEIDETSLYSPSDLIDNEKFFSIDNLPKGKIQNDKV